MITVIEKYHTWYWEFQICAHYNFVYMLRGWLWQVKQNACTLLSIYFLCPLPIACTTSCILFIYFTFLNFPVLFSLFISIPLAITQLLCALSFGYKWVQWKYYNNNVSNYRMKTIQQWERDHLLWLTYWESSPQSVAALCFTWRVSVYWVVVQCINVVLVHSPCTHIVVVDPSRHL